MTVRLIYVVGQLRAGGLERQLNYLLHTMDRKQYAPAVVVWSFRADAFYVPQLLELEVPIYHPPVQLSGLLKLYWFRSLVSKMTPEIVHSYSFHTNFAAWYACKSGGALAIGSVRSEFKRASSRAGVFLGPLCARWPSVQIFNSSNAAAEAEEARPPFKPRRIHVVRNGIDLDRFAMEGLPCSDVPIIVAIGSLTKVKRWDRLLEAALKLKRNDFQFRLKIVGDGPLRSDLEQHAKQIKIDDCVELVGQRADIPALLSKAALLVHTSESEGCPNVVMEAMACGRPVVATDVGDIPSLVQDGETGFVVPRTNPDAIADRVAIMLKDRSLCERMSIAARLKAEREFGLERLLSETFTVYRDAGWYDVNLASYKNNLIPQGPQLAQTRSMTGHNSK
jgi:glycosyltransferase involved in cell wall biosynthesis